MLLACAVAWGAGACSSGEGSAIEPSNRVFAGLEPSVVREVVKSKAARERAAGDEKEVAAARYQGMVRNFIACRAALQSYETWLQSGTAPRLSTQPTPTYPSPTAPDMDKDIAAIEKDLASGDITLLRDRLTNPTGCGNWIPAKQGDEAGPTIADVVNGKS